MHFDDVWIWGERIYGLNLESAVVLTFQRDFQQIEVQIPRRALYCMKADARYLWQHGIKPEHITDSRKVITFRELEPSFLKTDTGQ